MTYTFQIDNGDVLISSSSGRPLTVSGRLKLSQDLKEAIEIETQDNGFGMGLEQVVGLVGDSTSVAAEISSRIRDGIVVIQNLQSQYQAAQRTTDELLARLVNANVMPMLTASGQNARTTYAYRIEVQTADAQSATTGGAIIV